MDCTSDAEKNFENYCNITCQLMVEDKASGDFIIDDAEVTNDNCAATMTGSTVLDSEHPVAMDCSTDITKDFATYCNITCQLMVEGTASGNFITDDAGVTADDCEAAMKNSTPKENREAMDCSPDADK